jgi:hypothetical protein
LSSVKFLDGVPADKVLAMLSRAAGKEIESGKFASPESSAALAVNTFGWFIDRPEKLPPFPSAPSWGKPVSVEVEYCARFPWPGGRHPWLDAAIETASMLIGVESKRHEPFRDCKTVSLSSAYDRPVWGSHMAPYELMRDGLRIEASRFKFLDAAQLTKHAFGLVTDGRRKGKRPHLHYLYAEPHERGGKPVSMDLLALHRREIADFAAAVAGAEVGFSACSYHEWFSTWRGTDLEEHAARVVEAFAP